MDELKKIDEHLLEIDYYMDKPKSFDLSRYNKVPISQAFNYGISLEPLINTIFGGEGKGGLSFVKVPKGAHMVQKKASGNFIGASFSDKTKGALVGQAEIIPLNFDPTRLAMAIALSKIENKLSEIQETQQEILDFLIGKEKAKHRGNLITLMDIQNNYKYNWENSNFVNNKHIQVQEIKREAEQGILFYKARIDNIMVPNKFVVTNKEVLKRITNLDTEFKEYQLSMYLYSFSTYLEVLLLNSQNIEFIKKAYHKIRDYSYDYRQMYTKSYTMLQNNLDKAVEGFVFDGMNEAGKLFGKMAKRIPIKTKEKQKENKLEKFLEENLVTKTKNALNQFSNNYNSNTQTFINQLESLEALYDNDINLLMDENYIYLQA